MKKIKEFPSEINELFQNNSKALALSIGEIFYDFNEIPKGILLVKEGELRLIYKDENEDVFTIGRYTKGDVIGLEQIISKTTNTAIKVSKNVKADFLLSPYLFDLFKSNSLIIKKCMNICKYDLLILTLSLIDDLKMQGDEILKIINDKDIIKDISFDLFPPGKHILKKVSANVLICSTNINNHKRGDLLRGNEVFEVTGILPAKLLFFSDDIFSTINYKFKNFKSETNLDKNKKLYKYSQNNLISNQEALADLFGDNNEYESYPHFKGFNYETFIISSLRMLSRFFDLPFNKDIIKRILEDDLKSSNKEELSLSKLAALINFIGLRTTPLSPKSRDLLKRIPMPIIFIYENRPLIIWQINKDKFLLSDPKNTQKYINSIELEEILSACQNKILYLEKTPQTPQNRFGFSWFLPALNKHKASMFQIVVASFLVQLLALFNPLLIQQIIDAVINQGNVSSLNVLGTLLISMAFVQALLSSLRTYLFTDTTNRIDISLGGKIINHLLRLPSDYFAKRTVGETSSRLSELEKIREFLTGTAVTLMLDVIFSFLYIAVMMIYSIPLTFVSLAVIPFFIVLTVSVSPVIRRQIRNKNIANANLQSHMVETLSSVDTIKGQGIELPSEWKWGQLYSKQIQAGFKSTLTRSISGATSNFLSQLSGLIVIWAGSILVLRGELTIGQLIAFRILSGYVTGPILRLTTMWQNFQETALSLERISDIIDNKQEIEIIGKTLPPIPPIKGGVEFIDISYKFSDNTPLILKNINFKISPGSFVGIAGASGSGKSTLLKLINQIFVPSKGILKIDGFDIYKVNLYSLRSQIGVVPQESILFKGTIQQNIALAKPDSTFEDISNAAKLANAHDFIQNLPSGYSSEVGEKGINLSGGQRQRIAMARMFLQRPKLLLLDEATSSLDVNSEKIIMNNLKKISKTNTVFFVSHRLSNFINADQILFMHDGLLVEKGTHDELISLKGRYKALFDQRNN